MVMPVSVADEITGGYLTYLEDMLVLFVTPVRNITFILCETWQVGTLL